METGFYFFQNSVSVNAMRRIEAFSGCRLEIYNEYAYPWISATFSLKRGYEWIWSEPGSARMDMNE